MVTAEIFGNYDGQHSVLVDLSEDVRLNESWQRTLRDRLDTYAFEALDELTIARMKHDVEAIVNDPEAQDTAAPLITSITLKATPIT
jgi:hypothetical protein